MDQYPVGTQKTVGGIHTLGIEPKDVSWDLLPVQSMDTTWTLGAGGIILDDKEEWVGQGEVPSTVAG